MKKLMSIILSLVILCGVVQPVQSANAAQILEGKTSIGLTEYAVKAYQARWGYVYGTFGNILTEAYLNEKAAFYPDFFYRVNNENISFYEISKKWMGSRVVDCIGLVKSYLWSDSFGSDPTAYSIEQDKSADQAFEASDEYGDIESIPNIHGLLLYSRGHVGIYIGNGEFIHAGSTEAGVTKGVLKNSNFSKWYKCPWVEYPTDGEYRIGEQVFYYQNGEYVTGWFNGKFYGNDGIKADAPNGSDLVINHSEVTMRSGTKMKLTATSKEALEIKWSSSNSAIASVDNYGNVTAKAPGTAYIFVRDEDGNVVKCKITVEELYTIHAIHSEYDSAYRNTPITITVETDSYSDMILLKSANKDVEYSCPGYIDTGSIRTWRLTFIPEKVGDIPYVVIAGSHESEVWGRSKGITLHIGTPLRFSQFEQGLLSGLSSGDTAKFKLRTEGGAGTLKYRWDIFKDNVLFDTIENENSSLEYKANCGGVYMIRVTAVDGTGRYVTANSKKFKVSGFGIVLSRDNVMLNVGQKVTLTGENMSDGRLVWKSSAPGIAAVEDGTITGKRTGKSVVTVSGTDKKTGSAQCSVSVVNEDISKLISLEKRVNELAPKLKNADTKALDDIIKEYGALSENLKAIYLNSSSIENFIAVEGELYRRSQQHDLTGGRLRFSGTNVIVKPGVKVSDLKTKLVCEKGEFAVYDQYDIPVSDDQFLGNSMKIQRVAHSVLDSRRIVIDSYTVILRGDINCDGDVDISDLYILKEYVGGKRTLDEWQLCAADITSVGSADTDSPVVDEKDVRMLSDWLLGRIEIEF